MEEYLYNEIYDINLLIEYVKIINYNGLDDIMNVKRVINILGMSYITDYTENNFNAVYNAEYQKIIIKIFNIMCSKNCIFHYYDIIATLIDCFTFKLSIYKKYNITLAELLLKYILRIHIHTRQITILKKLLINLIEFTETHIYFSDNDIINAINNPSLSWTAINSYYDDNINKYDNNIPIIQSILYELIKYDYKTPCYLNLMSKILLKLSVNNILETTIFDTIFDKYQHRIFFIITILKKNNINYTISLNTFHNFLYFIDKIKKEDSYKDYDEDFLDPYYLYNEMDGNDNIYNYVNNISVNLIDTQNNRTRNNSSNSNNSNSNYSEENSIIYIDDDLTTMYIIPLYDKLDCLCTIETLNLTCYYGIEALFDKISLYVCPNMDSLYNACDKYYNLNLIKKLYKYKLHPNAKCFGLILENSTIIDFKYIMKILLLSGLIINDECIEIAKKYNYKIHDNYNYIYI